MNLKKKKIFISGFSGMLGMKLVEFLLEKGAEITGCSLDSPERCKNKNIRAIQADLRFYDKALEVTKGHDIVIAAAGTKGSPQLTREKSYQFFAPMLMFTTNTIDAAIQNQAEWIVGVSSVGVYGPAKVFKEDEMWSQNMSSADFEAGLVKRVMETQLIAYGKQYKKNNYSILRPVNIHGPFDNFSSTGMVIPSLIKRALESKDKLKVYGDGSPIRDFVSSHDVARAVIFCMENEISLPCNIGSGRGISIKELTETILKYIPHKLDVEWDTSDTMPKGDDYRVADMTRLFSYGFRLEKTLDDSIKETIEWYLKNQEDGKLRYDVFKS